MGSNRRYPHHEGQLAEERALREARKHGDLQTLTDEQVGRRSEPVTWAPLDGSMWGLAWLRFGGHDVVT